MNILFINDFAPIFPGSFFESLYVLSVRLKEKKHNIYFIFPLERDYITRLVNLGTVYYNKSFMGRKFSLSLMKLVYTLCRKEKIDIIHTNFGLAGFICGILFSGLFRIHHVSHERAPSPHYLNKDSTNILKRYKASVLFKILDVFGKTTYISISSCVKESLINYNKINPNKIIIIPNAVLEKFKNNIIDNNYIRIKNFTKNKYVIGMVSHFGPQKDHRTLADVAKILVKKINGAIFLLIGGDLVNDKCNYREKIKMYIKEKGIEDYFIFAGEVQNPLPFVEIFNIGCLISNSEGFGNAIVEYMLKEKPVIGTAVGGIKDIIDDGINGFLVPHKRSDIIAEKIIYLYNNPEISKKMGLNGYAKAIKEYNIDTWVNRIIKLYESV